MNTDQSAYYTDRRPELMARFEDHAREWTPILAETDGESTAAAVVEAARAHFTTLIPVLPYIGGDAHPWTGLLVRAGITLALYRAMLAHGKTAAATGKLLYDAVEARPPLPPPHIPPEEWLTPEQLMDRRRARAAESQLRRYPGGYVYEVVEGDGETFDYGYDFHECATHKFFLAQGAPELSPYFCFLDFPLSRKSGGGLSRTQALSTGAPFCNHRFKAGTESAPRWPPPFLPEP